MPIYSQNPRPNHIEVIRSACELAAARFSDNLTLTDLAQAADLPATTLSRYFHRLYGVSPMRWLWAFRTLLAAELIALHPVWSLAAISRECGFSSQAHFSRRFRALFHQTPSGFREYFLREDARRSETGEEIAESGEDEPLSLAPEQRHRLVQATLAKLTLKPVRC